MTVRYVGPGGSDANDGLSWATRKLTLNGVEDSPVAAGDTVYVGPGTYRERMVADVDGTSGNPITYIADVTGEHTDGVGGIVRVTGSDDDLTVLRSEGIYLQTRAYRTFKGFYIDLVDQYGFHLSTACNHIILEDTYIGNMGVNSTAACVRVSGAATDNVIRRLVAPFLAPGYSMAFFTNSVTSDNSNNLVENCIAVGGTMQVRIERIGGITIRNCTLLSSRSTAIRVNTALTTGQTTYVNNCIIYGALVGLQATTLGEITEDYNVLFSCNTERTTVDVGTNSLTRAPGFAPMLLEEGVQLSGPAFPYTLAKWSKVAALAGATFPTSDFFGMPRPSGSAKKSWGAVQYQPKARETTTRRGASGASLKMADASRVQFQVPVSSVSTIFSVYVYREANYAGTLPQMVIKQPGQADVTVTDSGAAGTWNQLTTTITPAAAPGYAIIELVSDNTATSGSYSVYWDDLDVS